MPSPAIATTAALACSLFTSSAFPSRHHLSLHIINPELRGNVLRRRAPIACRHDDSKFLAVKYTHRFRTRERTGSATKSAPASWPFTATSTAESAAPANQFSLPLRDRRSPIASAPHCPRPQYVPLQSLSLRPRCSTRSCRDQPAQRPGPLRPDDGRAQRMFTSLFQLAASVKKFRLSESVQPRRLASASACLP